MQSLNLWQQVEQIFDFVIFAFFRLFSLIVKVLVKRAALDGRTDERNLEALRNKRNDFETNGLIHERIHLSTAHLRP